MSQYLYAFGLEFVLYATLSPTPSSVGGFSWACLWQNLGSEVGNINHSTKFHYGLKESLGARHSITNLKSEEIQKGGNNIYRSMSRVPSTLELNSISE